MKILNLYAGIGGNRKHWDGHDVTAVELDGAVANIYMNQYPDDEVHMVDAHQYLLAHYSEFDFIWSSPPCQSHSRMIRSGRNRKPRYPDMRLYEEIIFLRTFFDGPYVVENVVPYYLPILEYQKLGRHVFWSNFTIPQMVVPEFKDFINKQTVKDAEDLKDWLGIHYEGNVYYGNNHCPTQVLRNAVHPDIGLAILDAAIDSNPQG